MGHPLTEVLAVKERDQSWLARKTRKSPSYVSRVIAGERKPSSEFKTAAAEALGVPESLLFPIEAGA